MSGKWPCGWRPRKRSEAIDRRCAHDAKLPCPSLVVVRQKAGQDPKWRLLDKTWEHVENPLKFHGYVEGDVGKFLREAK